jgi:cytoplasmic iron level regulating protein YaaA (DUF328/UPF0246 family)
LFLLLPPSETKRDGGEGAELAWDSLSFPGLTPVRKRVLAAVVSLAKNPEDARSVLKLGAGYEKELARNRALTTSPTMAAVRRYTGVLYEALDAWGFDEGELEGGVRTFLSSSVIIQSSLFGPVSALDPIPAYRLSSATRLPKLTTGSLAATWSAKGGTALEQHTGSGLVLDARSESYAALSPLKASPNRRFLRVVSVTTDGQVRALNHFNKKAKGELARALALDGNAVATLATPAELVEWGHSRGFTMSDSAEAGSTGLAELTLLVDQGGAS